MLGVGFTTGCLYKTGMEIGKIVKLYKSLGADAIELSFGTPKELLDFRLTQEIIKDMKDYSVITMHAPWKEVRYGSDNLTEKVIDKLKYFSENLSVRGMVLHPDTIDDFSRLKKSMLPFLLENMDKRKEFGICVEDFKKLNKRSDFGYVLDVQHAYEHDSSMKLAEELIEVMGNRLKHMHISGYNKDSIHCPTHIADNKEGVLKILNLGIKVPKILEGVILTDIEETISKELEFIENIVD